MNTPNTIPNAQFVDEFVTIHETAQRREGPACCFVLGSGTADQSNVPMGRELVEDFLKEIHDAEEGVSSKGEWNTIKMEWSHSRFAHLPGFTYRCAANFLPYIYHERYRNQPQEGCRRIEEILEKGDISFGYSVLSYLMTSKRHRVAITTYFDNLLFNAITTFTGIIPLSCGSESVMRYMSPNASTRPLIIRLQRDLVIAPKSDVSELDKLPEEWAQPLTEIFEQYIPIVIGYGDDGACGGNIMAFLEKLPSIKNKIYWCYRESAPHIKPSSEVESVVTRLGGYLVPILSFDDLMMELWDRLFLVSMGRDMKERASKFSAEYREKFLKLARARSSLKGNGHVTALTTRDLAKSALARWIEDEAA